VLAPLVTAVKRGSAADATAKEDAMKEIAETLAKARAEAAAEEAAEKKAAADAEHVAKQGVSSEGAVAEAAVAPTGLSVGGGEDSSAEGAVAESEVAPSGASADVDDGTDPTVQPNRDASYFASEATDSADTCDGAADDDAPPSATSGGDADEKAAAVEQAAESAQEKAAAAESAQPAGQKEITVGDNVFDKQQRLDIYKTYLTYCMTGDVVQLPMGGSIVVERDQSEFTRLSQLGDLLGLSQMDIYSVHNEMAERARAACSAPASSGPCRAVVLCGARCLRTGHEVRDCRRALHLQGHV
jgi:hypothetical protein